MNPNPHRTSIDWMWVKELRDEVEKLYNKILSGKITPNELKEALEAKINDFSGKKLKRIIREVNYDNTKSIFISIFSSINSFNTASDDRKEEKLQQITQKTSRLVDQFDKVLEENVEIEQDLQTYEREKPADVETTDPFSDKNEIGNKRYKEKEKSFSQGRSHELSKQRTIQIQRYVTHDLERKNRKDLTPTINSLSTEINTVKQSMVGWVGSVKIYENEILLNFLLWPYYMVDKYKKDWKTLMTDLDSDYPEICHKIQDININLISNLQNLARCINGLKEPPYDTMTVIEEIEHQVSTILEIVSHELKQIRGTSQYDL